MIILLWILFFIWILGGTKLFFEVFPASPDKLNAKILMFCVFCGPISFLVVVIYCFQEFLDEISPTGEDIIEKIKQYLIK